MVGWHRWQREQLTMAVVLLLL
jgi:hypothetical protein